METNTPCLQSMVQSIYRDPTTNNWATSSAIYQGDEKE